MQYPVFTGQAARYIGASEPKLNALVRKSKIDPTPAVVSGRRLWDREQVRQAAEELGLMTDDLRSTLAGDVRHVL
jgi:hypothetical protein